MKPNKSYTTYFIIIILILLIMFSLASNIMKTQTVGEYKATAQKGALDMSDWDIDKHPLQSLDGEWLFSYNLFLPPDSYDTQASEYIKVPGLWNSFKINGSDIGPHGYATYKLKIILPNDQQKTLMLKIPDMSSSYSLFVNDRLISSAGITGKNQDEEVPSWNPQVRALGNISGEINITVHVSNFHHVKGGIWESILIGEEQAIYKNRDMNLFLSIVLVGILLISVLYYLIIFSVLQKNKASLYLALFCLAAAIREFLIREAAVFIVFPGIPFGLFSKLEYMTVPSGPVLLALSLYALYPEVFPVRALKITILPFLLYMGIIIFTPLNIFGHFMNICLLLFVVAFGYLITIIIAAARKKKPGAGLLLFGTFIMLLTAVADMGYANMIHSNYNMAYTFSIGFIIFILCQMHSLSLIIAETVERSQRLSKAEMAFLQAQIVPHFLYNTLNTIIHLTRESPEKARNLLLNFSNYLRGKFNFNLYSHNLLVTFEHELELVKSYLSIENVRCDGRLEVTYDIAEEALECNIMSFVLQPLVENAVRHGLKNTVSDFKITIRAAIHNEHLDISIEDTGTGMPKEKILSIMKGEPQGGGTGLYNVNTRLKTDYGEGLKISSTINKGTTICIKIPVRRIKKHAESPAD